MTATSTVWLATLHQEPQRLFEQTLDVLEEARAHRAVHHPVVARERERHPSPDTEPGAVHDRDGPGLGVGRRMALTLSCDHRVMDGAMGARFLQDVKRLLEEPLRLLV